MRTPHCLRVARVWLCAALLVPAMLASGVKVKCRDDASDARSLTRAFSHADTVTIEGTCDVSRSSVEIRNPVTISGSAVLRGGRDPVFRVSTDLVTISGLTFIGSGIYIPGAKNTRRSFLQITHNTFRDFTTEPQGAAVGADGILQRSLVSDNTFRNLWTGSYDNATANPLEKHSTSGAIQIMGGLDHTSILNNVFDEIENDGIHVFWQGMIGQEGGFTGEDVSVSYNTFTKVHRIAIELQGTSNWPSGCPGGCTGRVAVSSLAVKGNYVHMPAWPYWNTYGYSLVEGGKGSNDLFVNNTAIAEPGAGSGEPAYGMETPCCSTGELIQGSVIASRLPNNKGWHPQIQNYAAGSSTNRAINNVLCGPSAGAPKIAQTGVLTAIANDTRDVCPDGVIAPKSGIVASFRSADRQSTASKRMQNWSLAVGSNLSVKWVQFFVDDSPKPTATQELQDVNPGFADDRQWLYHVSIGTSSLNPGKHKLTAKITDVAGATDAKEIAFVIGDSPLTSNAATQR